MGTLDIPNNLEGGGNAVFLYRAFLEPIFREGRVAQEDERRKRSVLWLGKEQIVQNYTLSRVYP